LIAAATAEAFAISHFPFQFSPAYAIFAGYVMSLLSAARRRRFPIDFLLLPMRQPCHYCAADFQRPAEAFSPG
jgi:hypothetical protein